MKITRILLSLLACALLAVIAYSSLQLWDIHQIGVQEAEIHSRLMQYKPETEPAIPATLTPESTSAPDRADESTPDPAPDPDTSGANPSIVALQATRPEAVGWLTVPNTQIDYPFAQGKDNEHFLYLDLDQRWSASGTIFMDFRNSRDFSDFNTVLFGHHMRNGSMFGTLQHFNDRAFFEANQHGTIFLADQTHTIDFFAFAVIPPDDAVIYNPTITTEAEAAAFLDHVESTARYFRDIGVTANDRLITLSTCNYEFYDARMVLIGRLSD